MSRPHICIVLVLGAALAACSAKAPASGESPRVAADVQAKSAPPAGQAQAMPPPDPREAALSAAMVELLEHEHLLRKPIDDELSRTAFATYLDRLDSSKMFLLRKDRDALGKYADKIDDELRAGSLELAHEGERVFVARVAVVEQMVAQLLAAPFNHDDEEWIELDPKKLDVATTDQELRDRWRRRLELEVLERVAGMEARLEAAAKAKTNASAKPGTKPGGGKAGSDRLRADSAPGTGTAKGSATPDRAKVNARTTNHNAQAAGPQASDGKTKLALTGAAGAPGLDPKPGDAPPGDPQPGESKASDDDDDEGTSATPVASIPTTPEARDAKARADLAKSYAARFARQRHPGRFDPASDLINAVTSSLDPHTNYLPPAEKANFDLRMSGSLEGIGALLREKDDYVEVIEVVPGGASWRQGVLAPGDLILSVAADGKDPVDVVDMRLDDVVKMIRGPKGTVVHLRIQKPTGVQSTIAITRDVVVIEETYARGAIVTPGGPGGHKGEPSFGYIHLPSFYGGRGPGQRTAAGDVRHLLTEMKAHKVAGVVLDIRSNGGGLLGDAIEMTGALIDRGPVVQVQDSRGRREILRDDQRGTDYDGPVVVLVDRFSASASEIVASALQDYHRAIVVGTGPTHGKGTVQTLADLDRVTGNKVDLGVLKITVQQFFRISGASTQREGVTPDILLPDPAGHIETGERTLEHAIPWSQIPPAAHDSWHTTWNPTALVARSAARVTKQPALAKIASFTELLRANRDDTRIPLARAAWQARRKQQRATLEAAAPDLKSAPARFAVKSLDDPAAPPPGPGGRSDDRLSVWRDNLARDPWVDECINILGDMAR